MTAVAVVSGAEHLGRVARLIAAHGPDVARLCDACVDGLPGIDGAGLTVMTPLPAQQVRCTSDPASTQRTRFRCGCEAKGILAENLGLDMATAFDELGRITARTRQRLSDVAAAIVDGDFGPVTSEHGHGLPVLPIRRFEMDTLAELRAASSVAAGRHGLSQPRLADFVFAVHEATANAVG
jgi:hypothetical protein